MKKYYIITKEYFDIRLSEALRRRSIDAMYNEKTDHAYIVVARFETLKAAEIAFDDYYPADIDLSGFHGEWIECERYQLEEEFVPETEEEDDGYPPCGNILWSKYSEYPPEDDEDDEDDEE